MMMFTTGLTWSEKLTILSVINPPIEQACVVFDVTEDEISAAKELLNSNTFQLLPDMVVEPYKELFKGTISMDINDSNETSPKRGKILTAVLAISTNPVDFDEFLARYDVTESVIRQHKRFTKGLSDIERKQIGSIKIKTNKDTNKRMIWKIL